MRLNSLLVAFLVLLVGSSFSQTQSIRKYSNEFLKIGVGARASAMGNAFTAVADDVTAGYWNPAGLNMAPKAPEIAAMHAEHFAGIAKYDYIGFTMPIDNEKRFAVTAIRMGVDDIPNTLNLIDKNGNIDFSAVEKFSVADFAILLGYAQRIKQVNGLSIGANVKVVNRSVGKFGNAWGFGLDFGMLYDLGGFRAGLMLSDVSNTFNAWTFNSETFEETFVETGNVIPDNSLEITLPAAKLGLAYTIFKQKKFNWLLSLDTDFHFDGKRNVIANLGRVSIDPHFGTELSYNKMVFLRGGFKNLQQIPNAKGNMGWSVFPTVGAGVAFKGIQVDYALSNVGNFSEVLYSHVFSLKYTFKKRDKKKSKA